MRALPKYLQYLNQALKDEQDFNSLTCLTAGEEKAIPGVGNSKSKHEDHESAHSMYSENPECHWGRR